MNELIVVLDLETTGLNNLKDEILEVGVLISRKSSRLVPASLY